MSSSAPDALELYCHEVTVRFVERGGASLRGIHDSELLIRLPMLSAFHCGEIWSEDFRALVERAGEVETVRDETTWASFRRYSSFRGKSEPLEGVVGSAEYAGPLEEFLPLLAMGGWRTLGSGQYSGSDATGYGKPEGPESRTGLTATAAGSVVPSVP